jgi:hypothetical protein
MSNTICKWLEDENQMLVQPDGQVLPCCYLSNYYAASKTPLKSKEEIKDMSLTKFRAVKDQLYYIDLINHSVSNELYNEYEKRKDKLNIFTNDLEDILDNEWFTKILPESWEDPDKIAWPCKNICTKVCTNE